MTWVLIYLFLMFVFVWNCQGAKSSKFRVTFRNFCQLYRPDLVVLVEPKVSGKVADKVISGLGYQFSTRAEARGRAGGIWILWKEVDLVIDVLQKHDQFIHLRVMQCNAEPWLFTAVYGSPRANERNILWDGLNRIGTTVTVPWLVSGDFNDFLHATDKYGGAPIRGSKCVKFRSWVQNCCMMDLGFQGPRFTWERGRLK